MRLAVVAFFALLTLSAAICAAAADPAPPEPAGIWTGPLQGAVPATIAGGNVVDAAAVETLVAQEQAILIDVAPWPHKPTNAADTWTAPPHRSLPGAVWLPDVGNGEIPLALDAWYQAQLAALTRHDPRKPVVIFCHPNCWASWNAAKRAIGYGYRQVYWYPDGVEGWQDSERSTIVIEARKRPG
jgi:PQQ-dependent catabolism-associated CXXCW motif protein